MKHLLTICLLGLLATPAHAFNNGNPGGNSSAAGSLTGTTLASNITASSLTSVGTLASLSMGGNITIGAHDITMTGSLGTTGARLTKGWFTDLQVTNAIAGSITGNAATATALATGRTINGVTFDGTGNITVTAAAGTLTGTTLNSTVVSSSLTSLGTIATGVWNGTAIDATHGGTAQTSWTSGDLLYASGSNTLSKLSIGTSAQVLTVTGGVPVWANPTGGGGGSGTVTSSTAGQVAYYASTGTTVVGTTSLTVSGGNVGIGTATPRVALDVGAATDAIGIPTGTTGQKPAATSLSWLRANSTIQRLQAFYNGVVNTINDTPTATGFVYNPSNNALSHMRTGIANVKAASGISLWYWLGTSTVDGFCSKYADTNFWDRTKTLEYLMAQDLTNQFGIPATDNAIFGWPSTEDAGLGRASNDTRITVNAGWAQGAIKSIGGTMLQNSTTTNSIDYVPDPTSDTMVLVYPKDTSTFTGTFSWTLDGGSATNISENATATLGTTTISLGTPGVHVVHIKRVSGTVGFIGQYNYLSTAPPVIIANLGIGGVLAGDFLGTGGKPYETPAVWNNLTHDAMLVQLNNNDALSATSDSTYRSNLTSIGTGANNGDVVMIAQEPYGAAAGTVANLAAKVADMRTVTNTNNWVMIDQTLRIPSYDSSTTNLSVTDLGYACLDAAGVHTNLRGYIDQSKFLTGQIMTLAGVMPLPNDHPIDASGNFYNTNIPRVGINGGLTLDTLNFYTESTFAMQIDSGQLVTIGTTANAFPQVALNVNMPTPGTNGTSRYTLVSRDTESLAAGIGGGIAFGYTDGDTTPRTGGAIWSEKTNLTSGDTGNGVKIGSRFNGESVSTGIFLDNKQHVAVGNTAPSLATGSGDCGTSPSLSSDATDSMGQITVGTSTNGGKCTITFAHSGYTVAPHCVCQNQTTANIQRPVTTTTTLACTGTLTAGDKITYLCFGH